MDDILLVDGLGTSLLTNKVFDLLEFNVVDFGLLQRGQHCGGALAKLVQDAPIRRRQPHYMRLVSVLHLIFLFFIQVFVPWDLKCERLDGVCLWLCLTRTRTGLGRELLENTAKQRRAAVRGPEDGSREVRVEGLVSEFEGPFLGWLVVERRFFRHQLQLNLRH